MIKNVFIFLIIVTLLTSGCIYEQKTREKDNNSKYSLETIVGNIKFTKWDNYKEVGIYVPLKIKNNNKDTIFLAGKNDYGMNNFRIYPSSYFMGILENNDTIKFDSYISNYIILPYDSVKIRLFNMHHSNNMIINEINDIKIVYTGTDILYPKNVEVIPVRPSSSKLIILDNNVGVDEAFLFGNADFE